MLDELSDDRAAAAGGGRPRRRLGGEADDRRRPPGAGGRAAVGRRHPRRRTCTTDRTVVATSATLALGGRFDTVARSLGLPRGRRPGATPTRPTGARRLDSRSTSGSPFDYPRQGILYVAAHLPRPAASGLPDAAGEELLDAGRRARRPYARAVLLPAGRARRRPSCCAARTDLPVLLQGEEALPLLVRRFREERASCLFGVMSLWQGVDVPGDACQLVVIDRLPFPRPDEPLAAARSAAVDAAGGSGFAVGERADRGGPAGPGRGPADPVHGRQGRGGGAGLAAGDGARLRRLPAQVAAAVLVHDPARHRDRRPDNASPRS